MRRRCFKKIFYGYDCKSIDEMLAAKLQEFEEENEGQRQLPKTLDLLKNQVSGAKIRQIVLSKICSHAENSPDYLQRKAQNIAQDIITEAQNYAKKKDEEGTVIDKEIEEVKKQLAMVYKEINNILEKIPVETQVDEVKTYNVNNNTQMGAKIFSFSDFFISPIENDMNTDQKQDNLLVDILVDNYIEDASKTIIEALSETPVLIKTMDKLEVLVVEDDESIRRLLVSILEREGFVVHIAVDGNKAMEYIDSSKPTQVVLLDSLLPYKNGIQILKYIRSKVVWKEAIIVMMMDNSTEKALVEAIKNGADDSIEKPFNPREMTAKLHRLIQRRREA